MDVDVERRVTAGGVERPARGRAQGAVGVIGHDERHHPFARAAGHAHRHALEHPAARPGVRGGRHPALDARVTQRERARIAVGRVHRAFADGDHAARSACVVAHEQTGAAGCQSCRTRNEPCAGSPTARRAVSWRAWGPPPVRRDRRADETGDERVSAAAARDTRCAARRSRRTARRPAGDRVRSAGTRASRDAATPRDLDSRAGTTPSARGRGAGCTRAFRES